MEKDQVTIALQDVQMDGPVGRPILLCSLVLDRSPQQLVVWIKTQSQFREVFRGEICPGALDPHHCELYQALVADAMFTLLAFYKGIQADFELLTP